ncbi:PREDICTED: uncharacterized protein LOC109350874 [Lupinus angustifolius]|uniref:uncharacterized protein LOC109350874 n=1 Tax=Lupinus angustifolius TaxID=3871 RepID=UPI00092F95F0|nr:PREDICTED: uncharacterized protein LOC109350874 [Lupinus angustifolius]
MHALIFSYLIFIPHTRTLFNILIHSFIIPHSPSFYLEQKKKQRNMLHLLYFVIFVEMFVILSFIFKTPIRKLMIIMLGRVKRGRGPVVVKTVVGTVVVVLCSSLYSMFKIKKRSTLEVGVVNPTEQVLMSKHMLEASLLGFVLFLSLMIDRLHYYIRELMIQRKTMVASKKQSRSFDDGKNALTEEIVTLKPKVQKLESECEVKGNKVKALQAELEALRNQSKGLLIKYDKLLEDNQNLRIQLENVH